MERIRISDFSMWEAFYWVAKKQSFAKAAEVLGVQPPMLSKKISKLESEVGVRLFQRTTRRVSLTSEAQDLFQHVESLIDSAKDIEARFESKREMSGPIRVACIPALAHRHLADVIVKFQDKFPKIEFQIDLSEHLVDLIENQIDVAFRIQEPKGAQFIFRKLCENTLILCASPKYLKRAGRPKTLSDLNQHSLLFLDAYEECQFKNGRQCLMNFKDARKLQSQSGHFLTELALKGSGIAVRSLWDVGGMLKSGYLVRVLENQSLEAYGDIYAVTSSRRYLPERTRAFIEFVSQDAKSWNLW